MSRSGPLQALLASYGATERSWGRKPSCEAFTVARRTS